MDKHILRQQMKYRRDHYPIEQLKDYQKDIFYHVLHMNVYQKATHVAFYYPIYQEVDTRLLIQYSLEHDQHVYLPKIKGNEMNFYEILSKNDLQEGAFHILEPRSLQKINPDILDIMFVPLIGYNERCYRIGYGKGFYDRYLSHRSIYTIGLAYHFQKCSFQEENYDIPLKEIITDSYENT